MLFLPLLWATLRPGGGNDAVCFLSLFIVSFGLRRANRVWWEGDSRGVGWGGGERERLQWVLLYVCVEVVGMPFVVPVFLSVKMKMSTLRRCSDRHKAKICVPPERALTIKNEFMNEINKNKE